MHYPFCCSCCCCCSNCCCCCCFWAWGSETKNLLFQGGKPLPVNSKSKLKWEHEYTKNIDTGSSKCNPLFFINMLWHRNCVKCVCVIYIKSIKSFKVWFNVHKKILRPKSQFFWKIAEHVFGVRNNRRCNNYDHLNLEEK